MLTLYGTAGSGSAAVELALEQANVAYRVVRASSWEADSDRAALLRANPLMQIPALQLDDGSVLTETAAILIHLGLSHPMSGLLPPDPAGRAQAIRGLVFIGANCYAAIGVIDFPQRFTTGTDEAELDRVRAGTRARLHDLWDVFADTFLLPEPAPYLGGAEPGALDCMAAVVSRWSGARAYLAQSRPRLLQTVERLQAHPRCAPVFARHWPR
jgi:GST-like protein